MSLELVVDKVPGLAEAFARRFCDEARQAIAARGRFSVALPGGSVAEDLFPRLARAPLDWSRVELFWGDERAVPPESPDSNFGVARRLLLEPAGVPSQRVHRMPADDAELDAAAARHGAELRSLLGAPPRFDLVLLGVGPDGHVCSLFPGHAALEESAREVVVVVDSPKPPPRRLSLTLPVLTRSRLLVVGAFGEAKAEIVRELVEERESPLPAARAARGAAHTLLLLDPAAARRLSGRKAPESR
jgi:6-phosphogluconolactonase